MQITVTYVNPPKQQGGKYGSIKATDGRYYSIEWQRYGTTFRKGGTYDVEVSTAESSGKTYYNVTGLNTTQNDPRSNGAGNDAAPPPERFWMPFCSNTVAHAITEGLITEPAHIKQWAAAAKQAALELDKKPSNGRDEFDDDIPFA